MDTVSWESFEFIRDSRLTRGVADWSFILLGEVWSVGLLIERFARANLTFFRISETKSRDICASSRRNMAVPARVTDGGTRRPEDNSCFEQESLVNRISESAQMITNSLLSMEDENFELVEAKYPLFDDNETLFRSQNGWREDVQCER